MSAVSISVSQILPKYNNTGSHANTFIFKVVSPNKDQRKYGILYCLLDIREDFAISEPIAVELEQLLSHNYHNLSPAMSLSDRFERALEVCNRYLQKLIDSGQINSDGINITIMAIVPSQILISSHGQVNGYYLDNTLGPLAKDKLEKIIDNSSTNKGKKIFNQIDEIDLSPGMTFAFCSEAVLQLIEEKQLSEALGFQNFDHIIKILAEEFENSDVSGLINSEQIGLVVIRTNNISSEQIASSSPTAFIPKERMVDNNSPEHTNAMYTTRRQKSNNIFSSIKSLPATILYAIPIFKPKHDQGSGLAPSPSSSESNSSANHSNTSSLDYDNHTSHKSKKSWSMVSSIKKGWSFLWYKLFSKNPRLYTFILIIIVLYILAEIYLF